MKNQNSKTFINQIEKALFGSFSDGQIKDFPHIRVKQCAQWVNYVCFEPQLEHDQKHQAAILSSVTQDECTSHMMDLLSIQDLTNVNQILDTLAATHHEQIAKGLVVQTALEDEGDSLYSDKEK